MRPYEVYMHLGLLDSVPKAGVQRSRIMDFIRSLREHPDTRGDSLTRMRRCESEKSRSSATLQSHSGSMPRFAQ